MELCQTIDHIRQVVAAARRSGKRIGFVPTMGALHAGHGALIQRAVAECEFVVVSIFVNPTQFGPTEDFDRYPRPLETDLAYCRQLGVSAVFAPSVEQMYPAPQTTWVIVEKLTEGLCGASRPGHFRGVATVCAKLFNIVQPDVAYFGQKDAQQARVIQQMVAELNMPLTIVVCPIVRDTDGLALSSRNQYLTADQRQQATCLYQALKAACDGIQAGQRDAATIRQQMRRIIEQAGGKIDYVEIVDSQTLQPLQVLNGRILIALAVYIGSTRLIDNAIFDLNSGWRSV